MSILQRLTEAVVPSGDANWDEAKHARGEGGKFAAGRGSGVTSRDELHPKVASAMRRVNVGVEKFARGLGTTRERFSAPAATETPMAAAPAVAAAPAYHEQASDKALEHSAQGKVVAAKGNPRESRDHHTRGMRLHLHAASEAAKAGDEGLAKQHRALAGVHKALRATVSQPTTSHEALVEHTPAAHQTAAKTAKSMGETRLAKAHKRASKAIKRASQPSKAKAGAKAKATSKSGKPRRQADDYSPYNPTRREHREFSHWASALAAKARSGEKMESQTLLAKLFEASEGNPNHDERGRFAAGGGSGSSRGSRHGERASRAAREASSYTNQLETELKSDPTNMSLTGELASRHQGAGFYHEKAARVHEKAGNKEKAAKHREQAAQHYKQQQAHLDRKHKWAFGKKGANVKETASLSVKLFEAEGNPHHDEKGRFASGSSGGGGGDVTADGTLDKHLKGRVTDSSAMSNEALERSKFANKDSKAARSSRPNVLTHHAHRDAADTNMSAARAHEVAAKTAHEAKKPRIAAYHEAEAKKHHEARQEHVKLAAQHGQAYHRAQLKVVKSKGDVKMISHHREQLKKYKQMRTDKSERFGEHTYESQSLSAKLFEAEGNPNHDKTGRFSSGSGSPSKHAEAASKVAHEASSQAEKAGDNDFHAHSNAEQAHDRARSLHLKAAREAQKDASLRRSGTVDWHMEEAKKHANKATEHRNKHASESVEGILCAKLFEAEGNPNHDERGRFASGSGGSASVDLSNSLSQKAVKLSKKAEQATKKANATGARADHARAEELHADAWYAHKRARNILEDSAWGQGTVRHHDKAMKMHMKASERHFKPARQYSVVVPGRKESNL